MDLKHNENIRKSVVRLPAKKNWKKNDFVFKKN